MAGRGAIPGCSPDAVVDDRAARQAAWNHSQALWRLRMAGPLQRASFDSLDGLTEVAGKGLLIRVLP